MSLKARFSAMSFVKQATAVIVFIMALAGLATGAYNVGMAVHNCYCNEPVYEYVKPIEEKVEVASIGLGQLLIQDQIREQSAIIRGYMQDFGSYENMPPSVKKEYDKAMERREQLEKELRENTSILLK